MGGNSRVSVQRRRKAGTAAYGVADRGKFCLPAITEQASLIQIQAKS
jgi:hypothetical protein